MRFVWLVPLLAGCLVVAPTEPPLHEQEGFEEATRVTFTLDDLADDVLLLELVMEPGTAVSARLSVELETDEGQSVAGQESAARTSWPCISYFTPAARGLTIGSLRSPAVILSAAGQTQEVRYHTYGSTFTTLSEFPIMMFRPDQPAPLAVALQGAEQWQARGGSMELTLEAESPFSWRLREPEGSLACQAITGQMDGGAALDLGVAVAAREKAVSFASDGSTLAATYVGSDIRFYVTLESPQQQWTKAAHPMDGQFHWHWASGLLPADEYTFQVHDLVGTNSPEGQRTLAAVVVHDVPDWALYTNG